MDRRSPRLASLSVAADHRAATQPSGYPGRRHRSCRFLLPLLCVLAWFSPAWSRAQTPPPAGQPPAAPLEEAPVVLEVMIAGATRETPPERPGTTWTMALWNTLIGRSGDPVFRQDPALEALVTEDRIVSAALLDERRPTALAFGTARGRVVLLKRAPGGPGPESLQEWQPSDAARPGLPPIQALTPGVDPLTLLAATGPHLLAYSDSSGWLRTTPGPSFIQSLLQLPGGRLLMGAADGLWCLEQNPIQGWVVQTKPEEGLGLPTLSPFTRVRALLHTAGRVFVGTRSGGVWYTPRLPTDRCLSEQDFRPLSLDRAFKPEVTALASDGSRLLVGMAGGVLLRVDLEASGLGPAAPGAVVPEETPSRTGRTGANGATPVVTGLFWRSPYNDGRQQVHRILVEPGNGHVWLALGQRLIHLDEEGMQLDAFGEAEGLDPRSLSSSLIDGQHQRLRVGLTTASMPEIHLRSWRRPLRVGLSLAALLLISIGLWVRWYRRTVAMIPRPPSPDQR